MAMDTCVTIFIGVTASVSGNKNVCSTSGTATSAACNNINACIAFGFFALIFYILVWMNDCMVWCRPAKAGGNNTAAAAGNNNNESATSAKPATVDPFYGKTDAFKKNNSLENTSANSNSTKDVHQSVWPPAAQSGNTGAPSTVQPSRNPFRS